MSKLQIILIALAITATLAQTPKEWDVCTTGGNAGVQGYGLNDDGTKKTGDGLSCVEYETQTCQAKLGLLDQDNFESTFDNTSAIASYCEIVNSELTVNVVAHQWDAGTTKCAWEYIFRGGNVPSGGASITSDATAWDTWASNSQLLHRGASTGTANYDVPDTSFQLTGKQWTKSFPISEIANGDHSNIFTQTTNDADFVFIGQFGWSVFTNSNEQFVYAFTVTLTIDRETSASKNLTVTKTLVAGQCCKNSLGVESELKFCSTDDGKDCATEITQIERNTEFWVQHDLKLSHADSNALKDVYELYPDTVSIGPFLPQWSVVSGYGTAASGAAVKIQSNVAFAASVTVASRLWAKDGSLHHQCFYDGSAYKNGAAACTPNTPSTTRRFLQTADQSGSNDTQTSQSKGLVFTDDGSNNNNNNNNNKSSKKSDDDDNTVLIAVVVSLVVVLAIGGIVGGIYYCKSKNQKQENNYNADVKNVQQQQQA